MSVKSAKGNVSLLVEATLNSILAVWTGLVEKAIRKLFVPGMTVKETGAKSKTMDSLENPLQPVAKVRARTCWFLCVLAKSFPPFLQSLDFLVLICLQSIF